MISAYIKSGSGQASGLPPNCRRLRETGIRAVLSRAYRGPWYTLCLPDAMVMKSRNRA